MYVSIPSQPNNSWNTLYYMVSSTSVVQHITGITEAMLRDEEPLSTVLTKFSVQVSKTHVKKRFQKNQMPSPSRYNGKSMQTGKG